MPYITTAAGRASFTYMLNGLDTSYNQGNYHRTVLWQIVGDDYSYTRTETLGNNVATGTQWTCEPGGRPGDQYYVACTVYSPYDANNQPVVNYADGVVLWSGDAWAELVVPTLQLFQWDTPKVQGNPFDLTAVEWNRLQSYVSDARFVAYGSYITIPAVNAGDQVTAQRFNLLRSLIYEGTQYIPQAVQGEPITAAALNEMVTTYNAWVIYLTGQ